MTSLGRGRGWANAQSDKPALRRPGTVPVQTFDCNGLINEINKIKENDDDQQIILDIETRLSNMDKDNIKVFVNKLYTIVVNDGRICQQFMKVFGNSAFINILDNEKKSIRSYVLSAMQADYEKKDEIQKEDPVHFRNVACLLFEAYRTMRTKPTDPPFSIFVQPFCEYLLMLLETPTVENLNIVVEEIIKSGAELHERNLSELESILMKVRRTLISENLSPTSRALLLLMLDLSNNNYDCSSLPKEIRMLYSQDFGESVSAFLRNSVEETNDTNESKTLDDAVSSKKAVPRAIRGSGAKRIQKAQKKTRASPPVSKRIGEKKGWDHDDRFEKDYAYN